MSWRGAISLLRKLVFGNRQTEVIWTLVTAVTVRPCGIWWVERQGAETHSGKNKPGC